MCELYEKKLWDGSKYIRDSEKEERKEEGRGKRRGIHRRGMRELRGEKEVTGNSRAKMKRKEKDEEGNEGWRRERETGEKGKD